MSIIFEALKKIEEEKREDPLGVFPPVFPAPPAPAGRRRVLLAVLASGLSAAVLIAAAAVPFVRGGARVPAEGPAPAPAKAPALIAKPPLEEVRLKPREIASAAEGFSAETAMPAAPSAAPAQDAPLPILRLKGLSRSGTRSWAFINDRMLKVGDEIEGAEVVEILNDRVRLRSGGRVFTLTY